MNVLPAPVSGRIQPAVALHGPVHDMPLPFQSPPRALSAGWEFGDEEDGRDAFLVVGGWVCSYRLDAFGDRRIVDFKIPGDTFGLRNLFTKEEGLHYACITDVAVSRLKASVLEARLRQSPQLAAVIVEALARSEAVLEEHLINLGRHTAAARIAHLLLELWERLRQVGLAGADSYRCPLTQSHLADALGLTAVHVNRTLRALREQGLVTLRSGTVRLHDMRALTKMCNFDGAYVRPHRRRVPQLA